jgi:hypothetical protein
MEKPFFIMMYNQRGNYAMPMLDSESGDDDEVKFFPTYEEAEECAKDHTYCKAFGYQIFEMGGE